MSTAFQPGHESQIEGVTGLIGEHKIQPIIVVGHRQHSVVTKNILLL
jgi:hypothetical protein